jgi:DNA helicase-2/ATP-dependent DNA helicase PcrA
MNFFDKLNPQQQQAVMATSGPVLVLAGPGSGKTRVLTHRIAYLIGAMGMPAYHILAVTFTNKAAREMETRVEELLGEQTHGLTLGTFHATCARILRRESDKLPFESNYVIFDSDDQLKVVKQALQDLNIDNKHYRPVSVHAAISNAKNELIFPDRYEDQSGRGKVISKVYRRYQELLLISNGVDFDDLLMWTAYLLENYPGVRKKYARRYEHVLVDEFQDTNQAQYVLLKQLVSFHNNIFVVGDVDQSIYRWRGADYRNVLRFEQDFPDAQVILLEKNYRSTQTILDVAMAVIDRNPHRKPKRLFTSRGYGDKVVYHEAYDDRQEGQYVVDTIASLVARKVANPGDFAVMYRTNAQSRLLEEAFLRGNLPYKLVGAQRFYGRREVKDVIAYLRLVHNPGDEISLFRVLNVPARGIGNKTVVDLKIVAQNEETPPGAILLELAEGVESEYWGTFTKRAATSLSKIGLLMENWRVLISQVSVLGLMDRIIEDVGYRGYIDDGTDEGSDRWENVEELRRLAAEYQERGLESFLEDVALVSDQDTLGETSNVPTLLTLHAAKGLEFPIVMIVGLSDGILPHVRSFEDPEAMHEERRLFYVGITRAKDRLYLVSTLNRSSYGFSEPVDESRFLFDIPEDLFDDNEAARSRRQLKTGISYRTNLWDRGVSKQKRDLTPQYSAGIKVEHPVFGEGMVLNSRIEDDEEIVDIFFESVGLKRVASSLAKLEIKAD